MWIRLVMIGAILTIGIAAGAEEGGNGAEPCTLPQYRQFDFWLGNWTAYSKEEEKQGTNHVRKVMGECAVQENWESARGPYRGTSYNFYDKTTDKWYQTWIDNQGGHLFLEGQMKGNSMELSGEQLTPEGNVRLNRITWTPLDDGRVRQYWQVSTDDGKSWEDVFDGYYRKQEAAD